MSPYAFLFSLIQNVAAAPLVVPLAIILSTFILEDAATVSVGVLAADGTIPIPIAVSSLVAGIVLGDFGLYWLGRLAITHPRLRRFVEHEKIAPIKRWLTDELTSTVITTRFLPGLRLPTYLACGFFAIPFSSFVVPVLIAVGVWTPLLFLASYLFGFYTLDWLGIWRWPIVVAALGVLFILGRRHWNKVVRENEAAEPAGD